MSVTVSEVTARAVEGLRRTLVASDLAEIASGLAGLKTVENREALGEAADLCQELARMMVGVDFAVEEAARNAFAVLTAQAGRPNPPTCTPCVAGLHPKGFHSKIAKLDTDAGAQTEPMCGCWCLRRRS